ncbi:MAG: integration host factor subunit alpha [Pseudomonadota bacterium]
MTLTKDVLIKDVAKIGFTKKESFQMVEALFETIKASLQRGEDVLISGFGKFCVKDKRDRRGRNPQTGEDLTLGARRVVTFKCSGALRERVNRESD